MKAIEIQKYFIKIVYLVLFIFLLVITMKYIFSFFSYKEGLNQVYNPNDLLEYNP